MQQSKKKILKNIFQSLLPILFFYVYKKSDIQTATAILLCTHSIVFFNQLFQKSEIGNSVSIVCFASMLLLAMLTLMYDDGDYIKIHFTIVNLIYVSMLSINKNNARNIMEQIITAPLTKNMNDANAHTIHKQWSSFFLSLTIINEIIRRLPAEILWVSYNTFGVPLLTAVLMFGQLPRIKQYNDQSTTA